MEKLTIGNGDTLGITHTGKAQIPTLNPKQSLILNNMLLVPHITKNLLSIYRLTCDNDVLVEFNGKHCYVKDKKVGETLLEGVTKNGLFQLIHPTTPSFTTTKNRLPQPLSTRFPHVIRF